MTRTCVSGTETWNVGGSKTLIFTVAPCFIGLTHLSTASVVITCPECSRKFNQNSALRRHIKIVHIRELPHPCALCDKKFALAESLNKHMRAVHLKSRGFPCAYCDYAASRADMLKIHVRKIHTKEWSYVCQQCEEAGKNYLIVHSKPWFIVYHSLTFVILP